MQDLVTQGLGLGAGQVAVQGQQPQPGQQGGREQGSDQPRRIDREIVRGKPADAAVLPGADGVLDPGMDPVGGVDVGGIGASAPQAGGQVGHPQAVPPAVLGLEQSQLGARVGALAAGKDPHAGRPAGELVCARAFAQQPGQLGDVRLFAPAPRMRTAPVLAGIIGTALPHLPAVIDRDLPGVLAPR